MADGTKIEWTDATWNVVNGCSVHSPGCTNCYAMRLAGTRLRNDPSRAGLTRNSSAGPVWTGEVRFNEKVFLNPIHWKRPRRIFVCAHGDLFHEKVPDEWLDRVFAVMALAPQHQFQVLTKRSERMRAYLSSHATIGRIANAIQPLRTDNRAVGPVPHLAGGAAWWPLPNVWLGVSVEDQKRADERIPDLLATPAAVRWLSCEPLLGPVNIIDAMWSGPAMEALDASLDWIVAGGESGPGARPMHPDWARSLRDQCAAAGVPFLFKQWGAWAPYRPPAGGDLRADVEADRVRCVHPTRTDEEIFDETGRNTEKGSCYMAKIGKQKAGRLLDGVQHDGFPA